MQDYSNLFYLPFSVGNSSLSALLDSGATRSFIAPKAVRALASYLVPIETDSLSIILPNGNKISTTAAYKLKIKIENYELVVTLFEVDMQQLVIFGADFCQEFSALVDFSQQAVQLQIGSATLTATLLQEELGLELNEIKELATEKLDKFCQEVSAKQFRKLLRKSKVPASVVVVRNGDARVTQPEIQSALSFPSSSKFLNNI